MICQCQSQSSINLSSENLPHGELMGTTPPRVMSSFSSSPSSQPNSTPFPPSQLSTLTHPTRPLPPSPSSLALDPAILRPVILGLSGPSSSGKSTIATALLDLFFPHATLVHCDDFYLPESSLPFRAGHRDWDCAASLDLIPLVACLQSWKETGLIQGERKSQGVLVNESKVENGLEVAVAVERLKREGRSRWLNQRKLLIVDGFLLFPSPPLPAALPSLFDVKILLRVNKNVAKERREARPGYVTLDGFWSDPPGYFDDVVWPNYVESHAKYFLEGNVEGEVDQVKCKGGVHIGPMEGRVVEVLEWVVNVIREEVEGGR